MPEQVSSQLDAANDLISDLRQTAVGIKELADEVVRLRARISDAESARSEAEEVTRGLRDELDDWKELLEDFRRGVRDRDEVIERTVGKHGNHDTRTNPGTTARCTATRE